MENKNVENTNETYEAVLKEWENVSLLFTEEEIEMLQEIQ